MLVELHIIQNFAPANLNRDDTGSPKDCEFGGYRRARISSQCLKRAMRTAFDKDGLIPPENRAKRTKRLVDTVAGRLAARGRDREAAKGAARAALESVGITVVDDKGDDEPQSKTQYLLFLGEAEIDAFTRVCDQFWDDLTGGTKAPGEERATGRNAKKAAKQAAPPDVKKAVEALLDGGRAADLALFGRMLADLQSKRVDAASQVAPAVSTNKITAEFDYYIAVDDLRPEDTAGADMIGTVEFNSSCFYRYANVDLEQLQLNLGGDGELTKKTVEAFLRAAIEAIPTGKQNSMAAHNPPSFVMAVVRNSAAVSLTNAFLTPVRPREDLDIVQGSIKALDSYCVRLQRMYGDEDGVSATFIASSEDPEALNLQVLKPTGTVKNLIDQTLAAALAPVGAMS